MIFLIPSTGVKHSSMILNASNILSHQMINNLFDRIWSITYRVSFNSSKSTHILLNCKTLTSYNIRGTPIKTMHNHKDLGILIKDNLDWDIHHDAILGRAYRTLGLYKEPSVRRFLSQPKPNCTYHLSDLKFYTVLQCGNLIYLKILKNLNYFNDGLY